MLIISPASGVEESGIYSIGIEIRSEDDNSAEPFTGSINKECFSISIMVAEKENECLLSSAEVTGLLLSSFDFLGKKYKYGYTYHGCCDYKPEYSSFFAVWHNFRFSCHHFCGIYPLNIWIQFYYSCRSFTIAGYLFGLQFQIKSTSAAICILHAQLYPLDFCKGNGDGQAKSEMLFFIPWFITFIKAVKDEFFFLVRDSRAVVHDVNQGMGMAVFSLQKDILWRMCQRICDSVIKQYRQDLPAQFRVCWYLWSGSPGAVNCRVPLLEWQSGSYSSKRSRRSSSISNFRFLTAHSFCSADARSRRFLIRVLPLRHSLLITESSRVSSADWRRWHLQSFGWLQ